MRSLLCWLTVICMAATSIRAEEIRIDFVMERDPEIIPVPTVMVFSPKALPLWLEALARPEAQMQRMAAETIADAHAFDLPDIDKAKPGLIKIVSADATNAAARFSAARTLIVMDAKDAAAALFEASQKHGADLRQLVEPALAKWNHEPAHKVWQKRLTTPGTRLRDLILAIRCVREAGDESSVESLLAITHDRFRPIAARTEAARSAGALKTSGLEENAHRFMSAASPSIFDRLCTVALLDQHRSEVANTALLKLAQDVEPSLAAAALSSLNANDPSLIVPLAMQAMRNDDANVRREGVFAFNARPTPERVSAMARLLDDPHPGVRVTVRENLFRLARVAEFDAPIRSAATTVLSGDSWRGQEQATLLLAALDHKPVAARFVELLESPRDEVMVSAAWGLRQLAVPETLPAILDKATRQTELRKNPPGPPKPGLSMRLDTQVALLFEAIGQMKYAPAEALLRQYVPKDLILGEMSRSAAIWTLGHLHANQPDEGLAMQLYGRLTEPSSAEPPEWDRVRDMSLVSMVRMKTRTQWEPIQQALGPREDSDRMYLLFRWATQHMTGKILPEPKRTVATRTGWFLEPIEEKLIEAK